MPRIVIIGDSQTSVTAIETLRANGYSGDITLFCSQGHLPTQADQLASFLAHDIKEAQVFIKLDKFFKQHQVEVIVNEKITRVSTKRHQLTTENKTHVSFDQLLITDLPVVAYPPIKGHQKESVFNTFQFSAVKNLVKNLHEIDNAVIKVTNLDGFNFACALSRKEKEVVMLTPKEGLLSHLFDEETSMLLKQIVEAKGIRVVYDDIDEILGDTAVKAVRLESSKVIEAHAVIFDNVSPDLKILQETELLGDGVLKTDEFSQTAVPEVFATGSAVHGFGLTSIEMMAYGQAAAMNMLNIKMNAQLPRLIVHDFGIKICDGFYGGIVRLPDGGREHMRFDGPSNIYKKIFLDADKLVGAVWMNAVGDKDRISQALHASMVLPAGQEDQFL